MALGEVDPRQAGVELGAEEGHGVGALRRVLGQQLGDELVDALLVRREGGRSLGVCHGHGLQRY